MYFFSENCPSFSKIELSFLPRLRVGVGGICEILQSLHLTFLTKSDWSLVIQLREANIKNKLWSFVTEN